MGSPAPQASVQYQQHLSKGFAPSVGSFNLAKNVQVRRTAPQMSVGDSINKVFAIEGYQQNKSDHLYPEKTEVIVNNEGSTTLRYRPKGKLTNDPSDWGFAAIVTVGLPVMMAAQLMSPDAETLHHHDVHMPSITSPATENVRMFTPRSSITNTEYPAFLD